MSLIHEYGQNKYDDGKKRGLNRGIEQSIVSLLKFGDDERLLLKN